MDAYRADARNSVTAKGETAYATNPRRLPPCGTSCPSRPSNPLIASLFGEQRANLTEHSPRGFVSDASFPLNLLCGDSATSRTHEVHGVEPSLERGSGFLKYSSRK